MAGEVNRLIAFLEEHSKVAIAFSGGVDSSYLLYMAVKHARETAAYYVKSEFQPEFEFQDALRLAGELGVDIKVLHQSVLGCQAVTDNPADRCYYCKQLIFTEIQKAALADGFEILLDGTNASDDASDRPGMKALRELQVLSPLRECGLTKTMIRELSRRAGLFTWDKPAYACLATRIRTGEQITGEKLRNTEKAEEYLFSLGFTDFRVRTSQGQARLQIREEQWELMNQMRKEILEELSQYYSSVSIDLKCR